MRVQIHTHPGCAYHSETDDAFPAVRTEDFLSLVLPRFAVDVTDLSEAHLSVLDAAGRWHAAAVPARTSVTSNHAGIGSPRTSAGTRQAMAKANAPPAVGSREAQRSRGERERFMKVWC